MNEINIASIEEYIRTLRELGVTKIAFGEINEKRPRQHRDGTLQLSSVRRVELVAYQRPVIYKCAIDDADIEAVYRSLEDAGFELTRKSRNIV